MQDFIKSIFAGLMIGIAGIIYLIVPLTWVAAILFSIGLIHRKNRIYKIL